MNHFPLWPLHASAHGSEVDRLMIGLIALSVVLSAPVFILMAAFAVKYRRGRAANRRHRINRNLKLEVSWALVPFVLLLIYYVWSTSLFLASRHPPAEALQIDVVAKQWMWKFQHPGGQREIDDLHVPMGRPVKLVMASQDVIHSLYVPALRLKQDVVPGRYTTLWFSASVAGTYALRCSQFCGTDHSTMGGHLFVMSAADYSRWLEQSSVDGSLAEQGARLFRSRGCSGCHTPSSTVRAPSLNGLFGREVPLADGRVVVADEQYIRDSILLPKAAVAAGYDPVMPTFRNILGEDDVLKLVAYIKSLRGEAPEPAR